MHARSIAVLLIFWLVISLLVAAQSAPAPAPKPISQQGLMEALRIGGLTTQELIDIVKDRGVAFQVSGQVETDLRAAGAATPLIEAVRASYRPPPEEPKTVQLGALSKNEIITLLQVGTPLPRIAQIVNQRSVNFPLTPAITRELSDAGADSALLTAVETAWSKSGGAAPPPKTETAAPTAAPRPAETAPATAAPAPAPVRLASLKEVHKLYVDKMKNNLDQYLRAELTRQLPGRFVLVAQKEEADAWLLGGAEKQAGASAVITGRYLGLHDTATGAVSIVDKVGTVLWASEAGDRSLLFGALKRGGAPEVANRLVLELKKAVDAAP